MPAVTDRRLRREVGVPGAVLLGLGSIVGTGVFVSIGIAAGVTGGSVVVAVVLAAALATVNGLNSAQLAASHPVSGGTYEYGYRYLNPVFGFAAGWVFLLAKSASAATAALGLSGYILNLAGTGPRFLVPVAVAAVAVLTGVVFTGIRRSNLINGLMVGITLIALAWFVLAGTGDVDLTRFRPFLGGEAAGPAGLLEATALMFVAFTGYGRIATLGEEVREPGRTIPVAVVATLVVSLLLYGLVAVVAVGSAGAERLAEATDSVAAPLEVVARGFGWPGVVPAVAIGAVTALTGVLLNLILGLSRVVLAMGRRRDLPAVTARLNASGTAPRPAVAIVGLAVTALVLVGDVRTTWSFSAFTVLVYYAITNLAALRLPDDRRRYPRWMAWAGLAGCLVPAFFVDRSVWAGGLGMLGVGLIWHRVARRYAAG